MVCLLHCAQSVCNVYKEPLRDRDYYYVDSFYALDTHKLLDLRSMHPEIIFFYSKFDSKETNNSVKFISPFLTLD